MKYEAVAFAPCDNWLLLLAMSLASVISCRSRDVHHIITSDTLATGAVVVTNRGPGLWAEGATDGWKLSEDLRIGQSEESGPDSFERLWALAVDDGGDIYVADRTVQVFDSSGGFLRTIGSVGSGPGEFRWIVGMDWDVNGYLWVVDYGNARYSIFDPAANLVATAHRNLSRRFVPWPGGFISSGELVDVERGTVLRTAMAPAIVDTTGETVRVIPLPPFEEANAPFAPELLWRVDRRGGVWFATTDSYRLSRIDTHGDTSLIVVRDVQPIALTTRERREAIDNWTRRRGTTARISGTGSIEAAESRVPHVKPLLKNFWTDDQGYLWVEPWQSARNEISDVDVFTPAGEYLGLVRFPAGTKGNVLPVVRDNQVFTVMRDEDDVEYVIRVSIIGRSH